MKPNKQKDYTLLLFAIAIVITFGVLAQIQANKRLAWQIEIEKRDSINAINQMKIDSIMEANSDYSETFNNLKNQTNDKERN